MEALGLPGLFAQLEKHVAGVASDSESTTLKRIKENEFSLQITSQMFFLFFL